jgi:hypothetical protein
LSVEHKDVPEDEKMLRVHTESGHYYLEPENDGQTTKMIYITEVKP